MPTWDIVEGHQLDGRDPEIAQIRQPLLDAGISPPLAEGADVELIDHGFRPGTPRIDDGVPQSRRIDDLTRSSDIVRLEQRGRIRDDQISIDPELIARAGMSGRT